MTDTNIILFAASIYLLSIRLLVPDLFDDRELLLHFWINAVFALFGAGVLLLGVTFFQRSWPVAAFFGTLFSVYGAQIALWSVGVRLDFLGNVPIVPDASLHSERELEEEEAAVYFSLFYRIDSLLMIMYYMHGHRDSENIGEMREAIKLETDNILEVLNGEGFNFRSRYAYSLFISASASLRFGSASEIIEKLSLIEEIHQNIAREVGLPHTAYRQRDIRYYPYHVR